MKSAIKCLVITAGGLFYYLSGFPQGHGDAAMVLTGALSFIAAQAFVLLRL